MRSYSEPGHFSEKQVTNMDQPWMRMAKIMPGGING